MDPTNNIMFLMEASARSTSETLQASFAKVKALVVRWAWLHVARLAFPWLGSILGV